MTTGPEDDQTRRDGMWGKGEWTACWRCPVYPDFPWVIHSRNFHKKPVDR